jgi:hypothetical protein
MTISLTRQTTRRARAVVRSNSDLELSGQMDNNSDIAFRVDGVWRGSGSSNGMLSWECGNCGQLLLSNFADLPFVRTPTLIECGRCNVASEAHRDPALP